MFVSVLVSQSKGREVNSYVWKHACGSNTTAFIRKQKTDHDELRYHVVMASGEHSHARRRARDVAAAAEERRPAAKKLPTLGSVARRDASRRQRKERKRKSEKETEKETERET